MEPTCKKFNEWKNNGKPVSYIRHNNAPENKLLIKITKDLQWKLSVTTEYTGKGTPQRNQIVELEFAEIVREERAMMLQPNLPEGIKYKLCKEYFNCVM